MIRANYKQYNGQHNSAIRYVYEERLGLHNARHAGARAAKGDILFSSLMISRLIDQELLGYVTLKRSNTHPSNECCRWNSKTDVGKTT